MEKKKHITTQMCVSVPRDLFVLIEKTRGCINRSNFVSDIIAKHLGFNPQPADRTDTERKEKENGMD